MTRESCSVGDHASILSVFGANGFFIKAPSTPRDPASDVQGLCRWIDVVLVLPGSHLIAVAARTAVLTQAFRVA